MISVDNVACRHATRRSWLRTELFYANDVVPVMYANQRTQSFAIAVYWSCISVSEPLSFNLSIDGLGCFLVMDLAVIPSCLRINRASVRICAHVWSVYLRDVISRHEHNNTIANSSMPHHMSYNTNIFISISNTTNGLSDVKYYARNLYKIPIDGSSCFHFSTLSRATRFFIPMI